MKIKPTLKREKELWDEGLSHIGGIDEAGRGAWAGPVVASVVVFSPDHTQIDGVGDSKLVSIKKREELYFKILEEAKDFGVGVINNQIIDDIGIGEATKMAFGKAVDMLSGKPDYLLVDAFGFDTECRIEPVIKGDQNIYSISCASIISKVFRDNLMKNLDDVYEIYEFSDHKGYGTKKHQDILATFGPCDLHRFSYRPIKGLL